VMSLEEMTDQFLDSIIQKLAVQHLVLKLNDVTQKMRIEEISGAAFPLDFCMVDEERYRSYARTVARITVPFDGDAELLNHSPSSHPSRLPQGRIIGNNVEFDIIFWGRRNDADEVKKNIS